jgi:glycerophosphoryl diester phosphodiesterase
MARRGHLYPPNSPAALQACLGAGACAIEMDISLLADGQFALLHGPVLEKETTGSGPVRSRTGEQVRTHRYLWHGQATEQTVGILSEAIEMVTQHPRPVELQLDLKPNAFHSKRVLSQLAADLQPVKDRVRVTSPADWALRRLRVLDPDLPLGFDPLLYLDWAGEKDGERGAPPYREGVFGYLDEHPLAGQRWGSTAEYLAARAEALWAQAPPGSVWYINAWLLNQALDEGFDWIAYLHREGSHVDAWTLDPDGPGHLAVAQRLAAHGVDRITTNDVPGLARAMEMPDQV